MRRRDRAVELFRRDFNCCQAVFAAYRQADRLDEDTALRLASVFGAGIACSGAELCGAVTGALMAISMKHGSAAPDADVGAAKERAYALGRQLLSEFTERVGSCRCEEILGINIGSPENLAAARERRLFETRCVEAVRSAADILDRML